MKPLHWVLLFLTLIFAIWLFFFRDEQKPETNLSKGNPKFDVIVDRNKPQKNSQLWQKLDEKDRQLWLEFEEFSPGNSYNPVMDQTISVSKEEKEKKQKFLWEINQIKAKLKTRKEISAEEKILFNKYLADDYEDQIDLLNFTLKRDASLTEEQKDMMSAKIKELQDAKKNLR